MKEFNKLKTLALTVCAFVCIIFGTGVVKAEDFTVDRVITGECGFSANVSEDVECNKFDDHIGYIIKFIPEKTGVYEFKFVSEVLIEEDSHSHLDADFFDDEYYHIGYANPENEDKNDILYAIKGHVYYLVFNRMNGRNSYNVECNIKYHDNEEINVDFSFYRGEVASGTYSFDRDKMELTLDNYNGEGFQFIRNAYLKNSAFNDNSSYNFVCSSKDFLNNEGKIKVVVKGKNVIKPSEKYENAFFSKGGISFEFVGDGSLECTEYTDEDGDAYYSIDCDRSCIFDGPTIKCHYIYANYMIVVKSGIIDNLGYYRTNTYYGETHFLGGKIVTSEKFEVKISGFIRAYICSAYCYVEGTEFDLTLSNVAYVFYSHYFYMNSGNIGLNLYPTYAMNWGSERFIGYAKIIDSSDINVSGGKLSIEYYKRDKDDDKKNNDYAYNSIFDAYKTCEVKNVEINIIADEITINNFREVASKNNIPQLFAVFIKRDDKNFKFLVDMNTVKIKKNIVYYIDTFDIKLKKNSFEYTGKEIKPEVDFGELSTGEDVDIKYENNINPGVGKVIINGKNRFRGSVVLEFNIVKAESKKDESKKDGKKLAVGDEISDGKLIYKITKLGNTNGKKAGKVTVVGIKNKSLKKVNIKSKISIDGVNYNVTAIAKGAFSKCMKLKLIKIKSKKIKKFAKGAFKGLKKSCVIKVPKTKKKVYKKKIRKSGFKGIVK